MSFRTTHAVERLDLLLTQAERFRALGQRTEASARARQLMAHADRELLEQGPEIRPEVESRKLLARMLLDELGERA